MIPSPPPDPVLGSLNTVFDGYAVVELIAPLLPVRACRPRYARYRPGRVCQVLYDLELDLAGAGGIIAGHLTVLPRRRIRRLLSRIAASGLVEQAAALHPVFPSGHAFHVPQLDAVMQLAPVDLRLPGLVAATSATAMERELGASCSVDVVRYKPGRRAVLRYRVGEHAAGVLYGKLRADLGGAFQVDLGRVLIEQGLATPVPVAFLPWLRMTLHGEAPGTRLSDLRSSPAFAGWMEPVAEAMTHLHATSVPGLPVHPGSEEASDLVTAARTAAALLPERRDRIHRLAARLAAEVASVASAPSTASTIHGSFHDDQVLVGDGGVVLLDLDSAALGHPLLDVGHFASYLSAAGEGGARDRFLAACAQRGVYGPETLLFEAASLLRWSSLPFRRLEPDWPATMERILGLAEARLADY